MWAEVDADAVGVTCSSRVFLCDDDASYRALVKAVLESAGAHVVGEASTGEQCVERVAEARPDYVLLDQNMPGRSGVESLPCIRERAPEADVVLLSTSDSPALIRDALARGARAFVRKPANIMQLPAELLAAVA
jgi:DNA-binding NarL/FixJ family response regulator